MVWHIRDMGLDLSLSHKSRYRREVSVDNTVCVSKVHTLELVVRSNTVMYMKERIRQRKDCPSWFTSIESTVDKCEPWVVIKKVNPVRGIVINTDVDYTVWRVLVKRDV